MTIQVKCRVADHYPPSLKVAYVRDAEGHDEEILVHSSSISGGTLSVHETAREGSRVQILFPSESSSGRLRAWIAADQIV